MTNENQQLKLIAACEELKNEILPKLKAEEASDAEFRFVYELIKYYEWVEKFVEENEE